MATGRRGSGLGLAAAVYAASEALKTIVLESYGAARRSRRFFTKIFSAFPPG